jgi:hypothetical protein
MRSKRKKKSVFLIRRCGGNVFRSLLYSFLTIRGAFDGSLIAVSNSLGKIILFHQHPQISWKPVVKPSVNYSTPDLE